MQRLILIVDDCEQLATPLEIALMRMPDVDVVTLATGKEALHLLANHNTPVAAVVTDLNLPQMDGFELISQIRRLSQYDALPIVVVTGNGDPDTRERVFQLGANAYYSKPYSPADVRQTLENLIDAQ